MQLHITSFAAALMVATSTGVFAQSAADAPVRSVELSWQTSDLGIKGLELSSSATYTDSIITNRNYAASIGKRQPRVPKWRAAALASFKQNERLAYTLAAHDSGVQYGQLGFSSSMRACASSSTSNGAPLSVSTT